MDTVTCPVCGTVYTEQTKPGTATRDGDGNWDRDTLPCPTCDPS